MLAVWGGEVGASDYYHGWLTYIKFISRIKQTAGPNKTCLLGLFLQSKMNKSSGYVIFVFNPQPPGSGCLCVLGFPDCAQGMVQYQNVGLSKGSGPGGAFWTFRKSLADLSPPKKRNFGVPSKATEMGVSKNSGTPK